MPTDREKREISKLAMAKKREEKEKIKKLKAKGLCVYKGEVIPVMEARKRGGQEGGSHGAKGAPHGLKGALHGWKGGVHGVKGKEDVRFGTPMKDLRDVFSIHVNSQFPSQSQSSVLT